MVPTRESWVTLPSDPHCYNNGQRGAPDTQYASRAILCLRAEKLVSWFVRSCRGLSVIVRLCLVCGRAVGYVADEYP